MGATNTQQTDTGTSRRTSTGCSAGRTYTGCSAGRTYTGCSAGRTYMPTTPPSSTGESGLSSFGVDIKKLNEIAEELNNAATKSKEKIEQIYDAVNELANYWSGTVYDEFKKSCENYRESLDGLVAFLQAFQSIIEDKAESAEDLIGDVMNAIEQ